MAPPASAYAPTRRPFRVAIRENHMALEPDVKLEHARWLLDRSDHLRSSYANRAALVLGIDAGVLGALFAVLGLARPRLSVLVSCLLATALVFTFSSVVFAFLASSSLRSSARAATKADSERRLFLSPSDTFSEVGPSLQTSSLDSKPLLRTISSETCCLNSTLLFSSNINATNISKYPSRHYLELWELSLFLPWLY